VFLAGVFFPKPWWAPGLVLFSFYLMSFLAAIITGLASWVGGIVIGDAKR